MDGWGLSWKLLALCTNSNVRLFCSNFISIAVTITVNPDSNDPPVATNDSVSTDEDAPVNIVVLSNDSDPDSDTLTTTGIVNILPSNGIATLKGDGTIDYTPNTDFNGQDSFVYSISDGNGGTDTATGGYWCGLLWKVCM